MAIGIGFNGKENDREVVGTGSGTQDYGMRIYNPNLGKFLSVDPLSKEYPWFSPFHFAGNTPIQAVDLDGLEIYYSQSGQIIGTYGASTEIRVVNEDQVVTAKAEFAVFKDALKVDPAASSQYLGQTLLTNGSVAFEDYFTNVSDVANTKDANFKFYSYKSPGCNDNCYEAAKKQMSDAGDSPKGPNDAIQTEVDNKFQAKSGKSNLDENAIGGAINLMTQLKKGKTVMVGVEVDYPNGQIGVPSATYRNTNALTSHFVVVNSATVKNGNVNFGYIDNATRFSTLGTSSNNSFSLDKSTGKLSNTSSVLTGSNSTPKSTGYKVTEVR